LPWRKPRQKEPHGEFESECPGYCGAQDTFYVGNMKGVERLHKTMLNEFYRIAFRKKLYASIVELQDDLDLWIKSYNEERPHQGRWCFGKTPMQTFLDAIPIAREKMIAA
jgi:hypothetical protein